MKIYYKKGIGLKQLSILFSLLISMQMVFSQTAISYSIGEILAAGPSGVVLADGTIAYAEVISLGSGSSTTNHGNFNTMQMGGVLNGINNTADNSGTIDDSALTIAAYSGSKRVGDFTRLSAFPATIDNGNGSNFGNAVGFRIWFSRPINAQQFLMIDVDGNGVNPNPTNGEWFSCFGYNGTTQIVPNVTLAPGTQLTNNSRTVNNNWSTLVSSKIPGAASFNTMTFPRMTQNNQGVDPDDIKNQGLFEYSSAVDNIFFLWGIFGNVTGGAGTEQNSGVSPLVFSLSTDFGDAPDTYRTSKTNNGASHEIFNYDAGTLSSTLSLGTNISFESTGIPSVNADSDLDEGVEIVVPFNCASSTYSTVVKVNNNSGLDANLYAWVDFNQNGTFELNEMQTVVVPSNAAIQNITVNWTGIVAGLTCGTSPATYMRIRLTRDVLVDNILTDIDEKSFGGAIGGEVEDYRVTVLPDEGSLPVKLISFNSAIKNGGIEFTWVVTNEMDNKHYEIERSKDAINFVSLNEVNAIGNYSSLTTYQFFDSSPLSGINYYRLKMVDKNGAIVYSKIISQKIEESNKTIVTLGPNPFFDNVNVKITQTNSSSIRVALFDVTGKNIFTKNSKGVIGTNTVQLNKLSNLSKGIYYLQIKSDNSVSNYKLVKQ